MRLVCECKPNTRDERLERPYHEIRQEPLLCTILITLPNEIAPMPSTIAVIKLFANRVISVNTRYESKPCSQMTLDQIRQAAELFSKDYGIAASQVKIEQYRLMPDDVLMTEGGDPDKLGRGAIIHNPPKDCIHQNHIFRVRLNQEHIIPVFMEQYLQHQRAKRYFLGCAKQTTGIASINITQLRALPMLMPPMELQNQFAAFVSQADKSKAVVQTTWTRRG